MERRRGGSGGRRRQDVSRAAQNRGREGNDGWGLKKISI
jgi:hypothetical protein